MTMHWALTGVRKWTFLVLGVWLLAASVSPAQVLRGPPGVTRTVIVSGSAKIGPFTLPFIAVNQPNQATGIFYFTNTANGKFLGFADRQATLPGAPVIPPLNNGSLQLNNGLGNIASLPLGDRLRLNGTQIDPDLIDTSGGGGGGGNGNGGNGNGQNGNGTGRIGGFRDARYQMMMAQAYQAQRAALAMNLYNAALVNNALATNAAYASLFNNNGGSVLPSGAGLMSNNVLTSADPSQVAFTGFSQDNSLPSATKSGKPSDKLPAGFKAFDKTNTDKP